MTERKRRGFAGMDQSKQREIASKGGKAAHQKGTAHRFTPEEARIAGRKGGQAAHIKGTAHEFTPEEARAAGRKGGQAARERGAVRQSASESLNTTVPMNGALGVAAPPYNREPAGPQEPRGPRTEGLEHFAASTPPAENL